MAVAETQTKATRGRSRKADWKEENNVSTITEVPSMPDSYNPEEHALLKEGDFDDELTYVQYKVAFHQYHVDKLNEKATKLASIPKADRATLSKAMDAKASLVSQYKKLVGNGVDVSDLIADLKASLAS